jgi:hypothetical protein
MMPPPPRAVVAFVLLLSAAAGRAQAQSTVGTEATPAQGDRGVSILMRVALPATRWLFRNPGSGFAVGEVEVLGASVAVELERFWMLEAGASLMLGSIKGTDPDLFARLGVAPVLRDWRRADGRGWMAQLDLLAGYRHLVRSDSPDGHPGSERTNGVTGSAGIELSRFHEPNQALCFRLLSGLTIPVAQTRTGYWASYNYFDKSQDLRYGVDLGFDIGVAF